MLKTPRSLIGTARKPDVTSAEIETALVGARAEITAAEQAEAEAEKAYKACLLALNDEQADALMAIMDLAARNRDRAIAVVEALSCLCRPSGFARQESVGSVPLRSRQDHQRAAWYAHRHRGCVR